MSQSNRRLAALAEHVRGQRLGEEQRVALGRLRRGHQHPPRRLHLDGEVPRVVGRQAVLADDPHEALVRARLQAADAELDRPRLARRGLARSARCASAACRRRPAGAVRRSACRPAPMHDSSVSIGKRAAAGEHFGREPQLAQPVVGRLGHAHVDHVDAHVAQLGRVAAAAAAACSAGQPPRERSVKT